jgi:hypothetical protein
MANIHKAWHVQHAIHHNPNLLLQTNWHRAQTPEA